VNNDTTFELQQAHKQNLQHQETIKELQQTLKAGQQQHFQEMQQK